MRGGARCFKATALVNSDIDQDRTGLHPLQHFAGHKAWSACTWNKHCANDGVGNADFMVDGFKRRIPCAYPSVEHLIELAQARDRTVNDGDLRAKASGHPCRMRANNASAQYRDAASRNAGDAAEQYACATFASAHGLAGGFNGEATGNFAHGCQ